MKPPEDFQDAELLAWHMFIEQIPDPQESDRAALIVLCRAWADMQDAERHIRAGGEVIEFRGQPQPNPYCKPRKEARATVTMLLKEFGLTPAARAKSKPKKAVDEQPQDFTF